MVVAGLVLAAYCHGWDGEEEASGARRRGHDWLGSTMLAAALVALGSAQRVFDDLAIAHACLRLRAT
jgi:hypothetical protein